MPSSISTQLLSKLTVKRLDHLGLVAGMCHELGIARMIDGFCRKF
ncbi:DUF4277 domain-containing protein [Vibrio mediterranei]